MGHDGIELPDMGQARTSRESVNDEASVFKAPDDVARGQASATMSRSKAALGGASVAEECAEEYGQYGEDDRVSRRRSSKAGRR
jgi:hypothetical protein